jgi:hypothetical protein
MVSTTSTGTTVALHGLGEPFVANDYIIVCTETSYGNSTLFIPDFDKIRRISSVSSSEDELTVDVAVSITAGDYILNIGADGATTPKTDPDLDAIVTLYDDPEGATANANGYMVTGSGGHFRGWLPSQTKTVDLLITDSSKNPQVVVPFYTTGAAEDPNTKTLVDEATPTVANGRWFKTGGTANDPFTDFDDGVVGQTITILAAHAVQVTHDGSAIWLNGGSNYTMAVGDTLTLHMFNDQVWHEIARSDNTA